MGCFKGKTVLITGGGKVSLSADSISAMASQLPMPKRGGLGLRT